MHLGAHVSSSGGIHTAIDRIESMGGDCVQVFTQSPRRWAPTNHDPESFERFKARREAAGIEGVLCHALYLVNLASPDDELYEKSVAALTNTVDVACAIDADGVVFHIGSHLGAGMDGGVERVVEAIKRVLDRCSDTTWLLMENTAGTGATIGRSIDELGLLFDRLDAHARLGLCEDPERRFPDRELVELRVEAAELVLAALVARVDLDPAHRQRPPVRTHSPELAALLRLEQEHEVDLDAEHLLHAADVRPPDLLERVEKRAAALDACGRVHHLVAMNIAPPALDLVLWMERELLDVGYDTPHVGIVGAPGAGRKT